MCGIFGTHQPAGLASATGDAMADQMGDALVHRGPDAMGHWTGDGVMIGNCRLSIIDLSHASDQPLYSESGDVVVVQNGEIYNYVELRRELQARGVRFHTAGDTEVLLEAYRYWGPDFVTRLNGMFAIAVHDRREGTLHLYRDRLGVKPLYIAEGSDGAISFASEIKALLAAGHPVSPDLDALAQLMALNYIPAPATIFHGIRHLPPGHHLRISRGGARELRSYWTLADVEVDTSMTRADAKAELLSLLDDATRIRMRSDAPYGAFLSGGLDSSSVVGFMSLYRPVGLRTYSIGFADARFDETPFALAAARRFGTLHVAQEMQPNQVSLWPRAVWHCDQPHGDVSFMPTDQVSALAARDVKMVLTGDGGDELWAGYTKYLDVFPGGRTDQLAADWRRGFVVGSGLLSQDEAPALLRGELLDAFRSADPYRALLAPMEQASHQDPINQVLMAETLTLLPGNNLVKPDRMAMANSLEIRSPFLDYRMAEFAFRVPGEYKLEGGETKAIYKEAVRPLLGSELTYRKKQMFTVPVGEWFRGPLGDYCSGLVLSERAAERGYFDQAFVAQMLDHHRSGDRDYTRQLRALVAVELWARLFVDGDRELLDQMAPPDLGQGPAS